MNRKTKDVVYEILENNEESRSDDLVLIYRVLQKQIGIRCDTPITEVFEYMKEAGISFESITRRRRKWLEEHPKIKQELAMTKIREREEEEYFMENINHIPYIY